jgi:hypothetical protein
MAVTTLRYLGMVLDLSQARVMYMEVAVTGLSAKPSSSRPVGRPAMAHRQGICLLSDHPIPDGRSAEMRGSSFPRTGAIGRSV